MKTIRPFLILALVFCAGAVHAANPYYPTNWYWVVGDTSPTTQVWNGSTGAMVSNSDATYRAWVGALPDVVGNGIVTKISASANNGSGLCRMTVGNTNYFATGNALVVNGTGTVCDGTWIVTVVDLTHVDLQGSTFSGASATTGNLGEGTPIATAAALYAFINNYNAQALNTASYYGLTPITSSAGTINLSNPITSVIKIISSSGGVTNVNLPQMNLFGSIPIGVPFKIVNDSTSTGIFIINNVAGAGNPIPVWNGASSYVYPGMTVELMLTDNPTSTGVIYPIADLSQNIYSQCQGGTGNNGTSLGSGNGGGTVYGNITPSGNCISQSLLATNPGLSGQIYLQNTGGAPIWRTEGGDCTVNSSTGAQTCTTLNGVSPGSLFALNLSSNLAFTGNDSFAGSFTLSGRTDATISADQNNWTPSGTGTYANSSEVFVDGGGSDRNITGLTGGAAGRVVGITNKGATNNIILKNLSGSSTAANQFQLPADVVLPPNTALVLRYDGTASVWRPWGRALANTGVTAGSYGSSAAVPVITFGVDGRATAASTAALGTMATQNANAVAITGGTVTGMPTPTNPTDVAIKSYVDSVAAGLSIRDSVAAATNGILSNTPVYNNGASGVGATLTGVGFAGLVVDGYTAQVGDRILIKDQATAATNGIYTVTATGGGAAVYVLTRATDYNQASEIFSGTFTFVEQGTVNTGGGFVMTTTGAITVGTTAINWTQFSGAGEITAGTGLTKSGNTLSITNQIAAGGPIGSATVVPVITYNAQGQVTTVSSATIAPPFSAITGTLATSQMPAFGSGDVSFAASGGAGTIAAQAVTYGKMQNVSATNRFLGRITAGAGSPEELTAANAWTILGVQPAANFPALTGDCTTSAGALATNCGKFNGGTTFGSAAGASTGTSGHTVPFLDGANTWSGVQVHGNADLAITDASAAHNVLIEPNSSVALTADRILTLDLVNAARTLKLGSNLTIASDPGAVSGAVKSNGSGTFAQAASTDLSDVTTTTAWTPVITASGTAGTPAYTTQSGIYAKVGNVYKVWFKLVLSGWTGSPAGNVTITGLPAAAANGDGYCNVAVWTTSTSFANISGRIDSGTSIITPLTTAAAGNTAQNLLTAANAGTTPTLAGSCDYHL